MNRNIDGENILSRDSGKTVPVLKLSAGRRLKKAIPFFKPSTGRREAVAVARVLKSGWITTGEETALFEAEFAEILKQGRPANSDDEKRGEKTPKQNHSENPAILPPTCLAVSSATAGLHLALEAVGVGPGDRVAVPTYTFASTAEIVRYLGADPIFVDSQPETANMDPNCLRKTIDDIKAVIPVHFAGLPCDISAIRNVIGGRNIPIIEDAAHAFPSRTPLGMAGDLGDIGVFSFYATKTITTGEGGMIATSNPDYAARMRTMRLHGIDREVWNRYRAGAGPRSWEYDIVAPGYKYNLTDIASAIGRVQLGKADGFLADRTFLAKEYSARLTGISGLELPPDGPGNAWHLYVVRLPSEKIRNALADHLERRGIGCSLHFIPLHRMSYWSKRYRFADNDFPVAEDLSNRSLSLPLWPSMGKRNMIRITDMIREFLGDGLG